MSRDADPAKLTDRLGARWATEETSFKWHASCRHTHPAADALQALMLREGLAAGEIAEVVAGVHQAAIDVLGPVVNPQTIHQAKFSMGSVLGLIAVHGTADLDSFERYALNDERVSRFRSKVRMQLDDEVNTLYPSRWIGKVQVTTTDGRALAARVDEPKGDPGNTLTKEELEAKAIRLAGFRNGATASEMAATIERIWRMDSTPGAADILPP
jgi:2-methylcitrate dehydratase PrpD